jgi:hypothetical protein
MTQKGDPPGKDFSAAVPVAMSREGGNNAIAYILVALHTDITNPVERVSAVSRSAKGAKHDQAHLSRAVINTMTLMAQGMQAALGRIGLSEVVPPAAGLVISNVPGMRQPRYLMGAKMTSLYPMSVLIHAQGLNITVLSYADELQYGLLSTPEIAPDVQHLADLVGKEFRIIRAAANKLENKRIAVQHATASQKRKKVARKKVTRKPQPARA